MPTDTTTPRSALAEHLGRQFAHVRESSGLTLRQVGAALGLCENTIRYHETGSRMLRADKLYDAAGVMGCKPAALLTPRKPHSIERKQRVRA